MNGPDERAVRCTEDLRRAEAMTAAALAQHQRAMIERLVRFARENTAFYRDRLAPVFDSRNRFTFERWSELPVVTRDDLRDAGESMRSPIIPEIEGPVGSAASSGTTGSPLTVYSSKLMQIAGAAAFTRACRWYGFQSGNVACSSVGESVIEQFANNAKALHVGFSWHAERILDAMEGGKANCFSGFPVTIEALAEEQLRRPRQIELKFLVGFGMSMTARARELSREAFGARAFATYSSKEAHKIAHECPVSGMLHVNCELVLVEILDADDRPCPEGVSGRVIVTPFFSTAQPLIRYEQGDFATWGPPCPCGRAHPVLASLDGRLRHAFRFAGGSRISPAIGHSGYQDLLGALRWQVAQTGPTSIEVRYMSEVPDADQRREEFIRYVRKAYHPELAVSFKRVEQFALTPAGKFLDYVNEWEGPDQVSA